MTLPKTESAAATPPPVVIVGAGPFGRALAQVAARRGARVTLWSRRGEAELPAGTHRAVTLAEAAAAAKLIYFCAPASQARALLSKLGDVTDGGHLLVHAARGVEAPAGTTLSEIVRHETPIRRVGVLAGPLVPRELEAAIPSAIVVASRFPEVIAAAQRSLGQPALRVYGSDDLVGVELSAALMTVIALACGLAAGLLEGQARQPLHGSTGGVSTRAVVVARGLAQAARILESLGAKARTLAGLGGVGEVLVTSQGVESPDHALGVAIGRGTPAAQALAALGRTAEGPQVARVVAAIAKARKVNASLFAAVADVMDGKKAPIEALAGLAGGSVSSEL